MSVHFLGIRHHGPGSCRNVMKSLQKLKPDLILLESPEDLQPLMQFTADKGLLPPAAMLAYEKDNTSHAVFYPLAAFSPEWQTMRYAVSTGTECRFFDLPVAKSLALLFKDDEEEEAQNDPKQEESASGQKQPENETEKTDQSDHAETAKESTEQQNNNLPDHRGDIFADLAAAAGYSDGEEWWHDTFESRKEDSDIFAAVSEAVSAVRSVRQDEVTERDLIREAHMRKAIRTALKEKKECIAVVCGAWHVPALTPESMPPLKDDNALLKDLKKLKIESTWIPWSYDRLSMYSGYGAGISSPGFYHHMFFAPDDDGSLWCVKTAKLLRKQGLDISSAHVIESVRLAQTLAAMSGRAHPSLKDFSDAVISIMGFGDPVIMKIIERKLIVSNRMGKVPDNMPKVPLLADIEAQMKALRLKFTAEPKETVLDLRKENDLKKSVLLHRLRVLGVKTAEPVYQTGKGTFKEGWKTVYTPENVLQIIDKAVYGNTLKAAAVSFVSEQVQTSVNIVELSTLLKKVMPADLKECIGVMCRRIDSMAASGADTTELMSIIPPLAETVRYGSVRNLDFTEVRSIILSAVRRIEAGGSQSCCGIDEESAENITECISSTDLALKMLNDKEILTGWSEFIHDLSYIKSVHPMITGFVFRLLYDKGESDAESLRQTLIYRASGGFDRMQISQFFAGLLKGTGSVLILDDKLWEIFNSFLQEISMEEFTEILPLLKRSISEFTAPEREKLGAKAAAFVKSGGKGSSLSDANQDMQQTDQEDRAAILPLLMRLLTGRTEGA